MCSAAITTESPITWIQPRELSEAAFRALSAAGADPAEAAEGAGAVLHAEIDSAAGVELVMYLLDADWSSAAAPSKVVTRQCTGLEIRELVCPPQPVLRTALQLFDLACAASPDAVQIMHTETSGIPEQLVNHLLLSHSARARHRLVIATPRRDRDATASVPIEYRTVADGCVVATSTQPPTAIASSLFEPYITESHTLVVVSPLSESNARRPEPVLHGAMAIRTTDWCELNRLARSYLLEDA